jgi:hypothetical protein
MKKVIFGLIMAGFAVGSASAIEKNWWKTYPDLIRPKSLIINAGLGLGSPLYGDTVIPPIILSVDYALPIGGLPFTLGGLFGVTSSKYEYGWYNYGYTFTYTGLAFALTGAWHPNLGVKNLDLYSKLALGYYSFTGDAEYTGTWGSYYKPKPTKYSQFYFGWSIGGHYFFTPVIGAYLDLGYSSLVYASIGVTFKIGGTK